MFPLRQDQLAKHYKYVPYFIYLDIWLFTSRRQSYIMPTASFLVSLLSWVPDMFPDQSEVYKIQKNICYEKMKGPLGWAVWKVATANEFKRLIMLVFFYSNALDKAWDYSTIYYIIVD